MRPKEGISVRGRVHCISLERRREKHVPLIPPPRWVGRSCERVQSVSWVIDVLSFILGAESNDRAVCITWQKKREIKTKQNAGHA